MCNNLLGPNEEGSPRGERGLFGSNKPERTEFPSATTRHTHHTPNTTNLYHTAYSHVGLPRNQPENEAFAEKGGVRSGLAFSCRYNLRMRSILRSLHLLSYLPSPTTQHATEYFHTRNFRTGQRSYENGF